MDETQARGRGLALLAGARGDPAGTGGRGRRDRALELSGQPGADSAGHRHRRRQPRLLEAVRTHAEHDRLPAQPARRGVPRRPRRGGDRRRGGGRRIRRVAVRPSGVHRFHRGRPQGDGRRRAPPDSADAGTGRQVAGHRVRGLSARTGRCAAGDRQVVQRRANLHRARLRADRRRPRAGIGGGAARTGACALRHPGRFERLHPHHQRRPIRAPGELSARRARARSAGVAAGRTRQARRTPVRTDRGAGTGRRCAW